MMTEDEIDKLEKWKKICEFYSNKGKPDREKWIAVEFLKKIDANSDEKNIKNLSENGLGDIEYNRNNDAITFEIKTIQNTDSLDGYEEIEKTTESLRRVRDVIKKCENDNVFLEDEIFDALNFQYSGKGFDIVYKNGYKLVIQCLSKHFKKYRNRQNELSKANLLIYCLYTKATRVQDNEINTEELKKYGWRSISLLMGKDTLVLYASENAPDFLKKQVKK